MPSSGNVQMGAERGEKPKEAIVKMPYYSREFALRQMKIGQIRIEKSDFIASDTLESR